MKPKLVDSHNYTYNIKGQLKDGTNWQCSVRNKETYCKDKVKQKGSQFTHTPQPYTCMPRAPTLPAAKARSQITKEAMTHRFQLAATIVNQTRLEHLPSTAPTCALPKIDRQANKRLQGSHPSYPFSLDLQLQGDALSEDFLQEDIRFNDRRHFVFFFTSLLLMMLTAAKEPASQLCKEYMDFFKHLVSLFPAHLQSPHLHERGQRLAPSLENPYSSP